MDQLSLLQIIGLLFDLGLVVLIWMVQLIIYPGFLYYTKEELVLWHEHYTQRIAVIVIPLMLGQLIIACYFTFQNPSLNSGIYLFVVALLWMITLLKFAPLHQEISKGNFDQRMLKGLITLNWIRTALWTLIFIFQGYFLL